MADRRRFGRIRQLPSGRWQARYRGPDGVDRPAPGTFVRKQDAQSWLVSKEAEVLAGDWLDPDAGRVAFREFATAWVKERPNLRPRTLDLYGYLLRQHILSTFVHRSSPIRAEGPGLAPCATGVRCQCSHRSQGLPAPQSNSEHGRR